MKLVGNHVQHFTGATAAAEYSTEPKVVNAANGGQQAGRQTRYYNHPHTISLVGACNNPLGQRAGRCLHPDAFAFACQLPPLGVCVRVCFLRLHARAVEIVTLWL